jgi:hypothetical protein
MPNAKMHPFEFLSETELASAHLSPPEALGDVLRSQPMLRIALLDSAHLKRGEGDYCPFDCEMCDLLRAW